jgi:peptidyl-Asp metalloendopeptidase
MACMPSMRSISLSFLQTKQGGVKTMISNFSLLTVGKLLVLASLLAGLVGVHDVTVLSQTNTDNELFTDSPIAGTLSISGRPEIIRTRFVMVNISALGGIKGVSPQDTLILNLFPDAVFTARLRHIEWAPGGYVWIGRIEEKQLSDVLLSVVGDIVMGSIIMPGAVYSIEYAGGEYGGKKVHAIHEINQGAFPPDEGHAGPVIPPENSSTAPLINKPTGTATSPKSAMQASGQSTLNTSAPDTDAFIDVMVVYTPAARAAAGGTTAMQAHVNLMISQTNTAYANSNITTRLRLVRTDEVSYTESGDMRLDLNRITNCSDGFMDIVCTWRNTYAADLVALIVENGQYCGIAWLNNSSADAPYGFSVTLRTCATANITFAHEVGHNQGMCHDWYVDGPGCEVFGWATYSYGYVDDDPGDRWRTILAYNTRCSDQGFNCTRILYFSNPSVFYSGQPTGVNPGTNTSCLVGQIPTTECDAHNARTLNESDIVIANFRQSVVGPANDNFANAQVISGNSGTVTGSNVGATKEPGEPNHAGNAGGASVWYRWTPSTSGSATIDTIGSNFDTLLAVYIGSAVNSLTLIASNDDIGGGNLQSRVTFSATAGTTYSIAVDGYGGATGNITLNWSLTTTTNRILTVAGAGTGNGTVTATGISCTITAGSTSGDCSESYPDGTSVTLTATAASGSTFAGWTNCDAPSGNQCTMTMNADKTVTATFNLTPPSCTNTGAVFRIERATGNVCTDGSFFSGGADVAEYVNVNEAVEPGDVVELDPHNPKHYRKARTPYSSLVVGVISSNPGLVLGLKLSEQAAPQPDLGRLLAKRANPSPSIAQIGQGTLLLSGVSISGVAMQSQGERPLLALIGRVPVKVTTENGPIHPGDLLTSASKPGYAMRCESAEKCEGAIIGKALEPLEEGEGLILVLLMR